MTEAPVIQARDLGKRYLGRQAGCINRLSEALVAAGKRVFQSIGGSRARRGEGGRPRELWALRHASFEVHRGEVIGIIGKNGAGKSTLLKLLSRITPPTEGEFTIEGRVASLLEVGAGFHAELTGRENVHLYGAILGMTQSEVHAAFEEIVAFAGVERFVDLPVKRYSSGMHVRLAFAVAAHLAADVMILDEVFAVGDLAFRHRCLDRIRSSVGAGGAVLLVSHNLALVQNACTRVLVVDAGQVVFDGPVREGIAAYLASVNTGTAQAALTDAASRPGSGRARLTHCALENDQGRGVSRIVAGEGWRVRMGYTSSATDQPLCAQVRVRDWLGTPVFMHHSDLAGSLTQAAERGEFFWQCERMPLQPGKYRVDLVLRFPSELADLVEDALVVEVVEGDFFGGGRLYPPEFGTFLVEGKWHHQAPS
ncbi:MAG: ABC transporter ATP-binding protein [Verrucomicrobiales bacterium]|nr:ABC transporter ATP-binding protein [Verrucomicrobiales bacterium]